MPVRKRDDKKKCTGEETIQITSVTGFGATKERAHENMLSILAMNCSTSKCQGDCSGGDDCLPAVYIDDEDDVDCRPYQTKAGKIKWRCKYSGKIRCVCECLDPS